MSFRLSRSQKSGFCQKNGLRRLDSGKIDTIDKRWFEGNLKFGKFSLFFELKAEQTFRCERRTLALSRATADECRYTRDMRYAFGQSWSENNVSPLAPQPLVWCLSCCPFLEFSREKTTIDGEQRGRDEAKSVYCRLCSVCYVCYILYRGAFSQPIVY